MRGIGWFIVMDRAKAPAADSARRAHGFQSGPVLPAQGTVGIPGIGHENRLSGIELYPALTCAGRFFNDPW